MSPQWTKPPQGGLNQLNPKPMLHKLISFLPTFFAIYISDNVASGLLLFVSTLALGLYHSISLAEEPYKGALADTKVMWLIHIIGVMVYTMLRYNPF